MDTTGSLLPRARRSVCQAERKEGRLILQGGIDWLVEGEPSELRTIADALPGMNEPLRDNLLLLNFRNAVGRFDLPVLGPVEVFSAKWKKQHFDWMLADLTDIAAGLPFAGKAAAALPYDRTVAASEDVTYHAFVYLRHIVSDTPPIAERLLPALSVILAEPHRKLIRTNREVPIGLVHRVGASAFVDLLSGRGQMVRVDEETASRIVLARVLRDHVPVRVSVDQTESALDTAENRFVKTFLQSTLAIIEKMRQVFRTRARDDPFACRILRDCDSMEKKLMPLVQHSMWDQVGPMVHLPASSTVLHRRRGYRQVFHHFSKLRLAARVPLSKELVRDLLEAKDIAQLYEVWAFFQLVRTMSDLLGPPAKVSSPHSDEMQISIPFDFDVTWPGSIRVTYNSRFSRRQTNGHYSYSLPLRPDITLDLPVGHAAGLHIFDAKFRLQTLDAIIPSDELEDAEEAAEEQRGTFRRGDLYKMHTYRDAIPGTRSVWALYPGSELAFYGTDGTKASTEQLNLGSLQGVGAIPLLPDRRQHSQLSQVLSEILRYVVT